MAADLSVLYEHAVIQDLQLSLERAREDKRELRETVEVLLSKLSNAEKVIKATNKYVQALDEGVEDPTGHMVEMARAISEWNSTAKK